MTPSIVRLAIWLVLAFGICTSVSLPFAPRAVVIDDISQLKPQYDYIICGGGTSGLVVANRLTEDPSSMWHVCPVLQIRTLTRLDDCSQRSRD